MADGYAIRRPGPADIERLERFAASTVPRARPGMIARRWWWNDVIPHCLIAVHGASGEIGATCGARRGEVVIEGGRVPSVSISDWYVSPHHRGLGVGRALVVEAIGQARVAFTTSISESAAAAFTKMGWRGCDRLPVLLGAPLVVAAMGRVRRTPGIVLHEGVVSSFEGAAMLARAGATWSPAPGLPVMAPRDAVALRSHLALAPTRRYQLVIAFCNEGPVGYLLYRMLPAGAVRRLPFARVGLVVDSWAAGSARSAVLQAMTVRAASGMARSGAAVMVAMATQRWAIDALGSLSFAAPTTPVLGPLVGGLSSLAMHHGADLPPFEGWHLTFADGDTDLILGDASESQKGSSRLLLQRQ